MKSGFAFVKLPYRYLELYYSVVFKQVYLSSSVLALFPYVLEIIHGLRHIADVQ